jgi:CRISPR-associated protein (TIGR02584 family)
MNKRKTNTTNRNEALLQTPQVGADENACNPRIPHSYPRRVLLAVSGLSPQIVTETIYALTQTSDAPWIPTEIHILTTTTGEQRARLSLFSKDKNWFAKLCSEYDLPNIQFDASHIHILRDSQGLPLSDIRSISDNSAAADAITAKVRELCADSRSAVHVSIAGGRKSMGFYVGYALSLYGRSQDRLSHVLVSDPYEHSLDFFYPTRHSCVLEARDGGMVDTKDAIVTLADIPFVSLRSGLPEELLHGDASFNETVEAAREALAPPKLHINLHERYVVAGRKTFKLAPTAIAMLAVFARRKKAGLRAVPAPNKEVPDPEWAQWYLAEYRICSGGEWASAEATQKTLSKGMDGRWFSTTLTRLHQSLRKALGPAATHYCVQDGGKHPRNYSLQLDASAIQFID